MIGAGLAYEQGPDFGTPLRLFLAAPWFLLLAAVLALAFPEQWLASRWSPAALAVTHLLTLGFLGLVMTGALLQMLPVVVGAPVPAAALVGNMALAGLGGGTLLLAAGFMLGEPGLLLLAAAALAAGLAPFLLGTAASLARARSLPRVAWPMRQAWFALLVTAALGMALAAALAGSLPLADPAGLTGLHATWGLGGWILVLVMGVAYQVVPMLQLTQPYPERLVAVFIWTMPTALALATLAHVLPAHILPLQAWPAWLLGAAGAVAFALATLHLQQRRRRKVADVTLDFWRLGMASLILTAILLPAALADGNPWREQTQITLGLAFLLGFAASVVHGMLYKIVPFLAWFHLQAQVGYRPGGTPNMKQYIPDAACRRHFRLHLATVLLLAPAPFLPPLAAIPGSLALGAGGLVLGWNLHQARRMYLAHGGRLSA